MTAGYVVLPVASRRAPRKATPAAEAGYTRHIDTTRLPDHRGGLQYAEKPFMLIDNRLEKELIRTSTYLHLRQEKALPLHQKIVES